MSLSQCFLMVHLACSSSIGSQRGHSVDTRPRFLGFIPFEIMSNTSNEILNLDALSGVAGGKSHPGFVSDPVFQDDVERIIRQWQFLKGMMVAISIIMALAMAMASLCCILTRSFALCSYI